MSSPTLLALSFPSLVVFFGLLSDSPKAEKPRNTQATYEDEGCPEKYLGKHQVRPFGMEELSLLKNSTLWIMSFFLGKIGPNWSFGPWNAKKKGTSPHPPDPRLLPSGCWHKLQINRLSPDTWRIIPWPTDTRWKKNMVIVGPWDPKDRVVNPFQMAVLWRL